LEEDDYVMTYGALNRQLHLNGISLGNAHGNVIDVLKVEKRPNLLGWIKRKPKTTVLGVIGFQGWTRGVPHKERKALAAYTDLAHLKSAGGISLIPSLINTYDIVLHAIAKKTTPLPSKGMRNGQSVSIDDSSGKREHGTKTPGTLPHN
jgi:hypothetical protein